jgi:hypothetical protein
MQFSPAEQVDSLRLRHPSIKRATPMASGAIFVRAARALAHRLAKKISAGNLFRGSNLRFAAVS